MGKGWTADWPDGEKTGVVGQARERERKRPLSGPSGKNRGITEHKEMMIK
jgi:hypothetical protein